MSPSKETEVKMPSLIPVVQNYHVDEEEEEGEYWDLWDEDTLFFGYDMTFSCRVVDFVRERERKKKRMMWFMTDMNTCVCVCVCVRGVVEQPRPVWGVEKVRRRTPTRSTSR